MKIHLTLLLLVVATGCTTNRLPPISIAKRDSTSKVPVDSLVDATIFGFGVKRGQKERKTDKAFEALLSHPDAKVQFLAVFKQGNVYSKLYALCALRYLDKPLFERLAKGMNPGETIRTRFGCVVDDSTVGKIITTIENGRYDYITTKTTNAEQAGKP